jgi:hypothetical protein
MEEKKVYTLGEIKKYILESVKNEFEPVIGGSVEKENRKNNDAAYREASKKNAGELGKPKVTESGDQEVADILKRGMERIKYDGGTDKAFKDRVKAQVMGKASTLQKDIDDRASGVDTSGNEKFLKKAEKMNKFDNDHLGLGGKGQSIVQLGSHIAPGKDAPAKLSTAFESKTRVVRVGDILTETKGNRKLKLISLSEGTCHFTDEQSGKNYSVTKENFRKAVREGKMVKEEVAPKPLKENVSPSKSMKRINFRKDRFKCEEHMASLIPEHYKVQGNRFYMKDAADNEYLVEWNEKEKNRVLVLEHKNERENAEQMAKIKHLYEYDSRNTSISLDGDGRLNEVAQMDRLLGKARSLI